LFAGDPHDVRHRFSLIFGWGALWLSFDRCQALGLLLGFGVLTAAGISFGTIVSRGHGHHRWFNAYRGRAMAVTLSASGFAAYYRRPRNATAYCGNAASGGGAIWWQGFLFLSAVGRIFFL